MVCSNGVSPECRLLGVESDIRCHAQWDEMPQYWASLDLRVSREKAPALAQAFGSQSLRRAGTIDSVWPICSPRVCSKCHHRPCDAIFVCCKIVTVQRKSEPLCTAAACVSNICSRSSVSPVIDFRQLIVASGSVRSRSKARRNNRVIVSRSGCMRPGKRDRLADDAILVDETCRRPWKKLRLLTSDERRKCDTQGP
jgi:hypothetical protein